MDAATRGSRRRRTRACSASRSTRSRRTQCGSCCRSPRATPIRARCCTAASPRRWWRWRDRPSRARRSPSEAAPFHSATLQVTYLAAAKAEAVVAEARLLRAGRNSASPDVQVRTQRRQGDRAGLVTVRGRSGAADAQLPEIRGDDGDAEPGPMGPHVAKTPFMGRLGLRIEHMSGGTSRIVLPLSRRAPDASGGVHEGAALALLDTTGAMAAWAVTGPGRLRRLDAGTSCAVSGATARGRPRRVRSLGAPRRRVTLV